MSASGKGKLAALTGGTGFLGRYIACALAKDGYRVRMLARSLAVHPQLQELTPDIIPGSLTDDGVCKRLVQGADLVVHCAGLIKARNAAEFMTINGEGTARLASHWADETRHKSGSRFVLISSLAAREPELSDYAASKRAGEEALREIDGDWLIVRPAAVYGPWDTETLTVFRAQKWPLQPLMAGPDARVGLIHAADAAGAVIRLGAKGKPRQIYELSDPNLEGYSWKEIVTCAARSMNVAARPVQLPGAMVRAASRVSRYFPQRGKGISIFSEGKVREILHTDWAVDPEKVPPKSIWSPQIALDQGFADTTSWYRAAGWL